MRSWEAYMLSRFTEFGLRATAASRVERAVRGSPARLYSSTRPRSARESSGSIASTRSKYGNASRQLGLVRRERFRLLDPFAGLVAIFGEAPREQRAPNGWLAVGGLLGEVARVVPCRVVAPGIG